MRRMALFICSEMQVFLVSSIYYEMDMQLGGAEGQTKRTEMVRGDCPKSSSLK